MKDNESWMEKEYKRLNLKIQTVLDQSTELQIAFNNKHNAFNEEDVQKNTNVIA